MPKISAIARLNRKKYAHPPSWQQIEAFLAEVNMNMYAFEDFYGIPFNTLTEVKKGKRNLPKNVWHYIYEKIKPAYGVGFIDDCTKNVLKDSDKSYLTKNKTTKPLPEGDLDPNHGRIPDIN